MKKSLKVIVKSIFYIMENVSKNALLVTAMVKNAKLVMKKMANMINA